MEAINRSLFQNNNLADLFAQTTQGGVNSQYGVYTRTKVRAELEITTAEGDRVTLFSQSKTGTAYSSYDSRGKLTGTESAGTTSMYQIVSTNKVSIAVEGNLSEEELGDIQRLLQSVEDIFMNSLSDDGTIEENLASSLSLDSMKTISHFDAELKYSQKIEGFGIVSGSTGQIPDTTTSQESAASGNGLISETNPDATSVETTAPEPAMNSVSMINFEAKTKTSIYVKVAQSLLNTAPAVSGTPQEASAPVQPPADGTSAPVSADGTTATNQATDTSSANTGTLSSLSTSRNKLVEEFAALIQQYSVDMNRMSTVFSQFIPSLIEQLKNNYTMDEIQKGAVTQMGDDILNTFQSTSPELIQ